MCDFLKILNKFSYLQLMFDLKKVNIFPVIFFFVILLNLVFKLWVAAVAWQMEK